jgi:hypothetical protein
MRHPGVQAFGGGVGDPGGGEVVEHALQVAVDHAGDIDHRLQP